MHLSISPCPATHTLTMKGWEMEERICFSLLTCSTCFSLMTSLIVMIFRAKKFLLGRCLVRTTRPNVPVPTEGEHVPHIPVTLPHNCGCLIRYGVCAGGTGNTRYYYRHSEISFLVAQYHCDVIRQRPPQALHLLDTREAGIMSLPGVLKETQLSVLCALLQQTSV